MVIPLHQVWNIYLFILVPIFHIVQILNFVILQKYLIISFVTQNILNTYTSLRNLVTRAIHRHIKVKQKSHLECIKKTGAMKKSTYQEEDIFMKKKKLKYII